MKYNTYSRVFSTHHITTSHQRHLFIHLTLSSILNAALQLFLNEFQLSFNLFTPPRNSSHITTTFSDFRLLISVDIFCCNKAVQKAMPINANYHLTKKTSKHGYLTSIGFTKKLGCSVASFFSPLTTVPNNTVSVCRVRRLSRRKVSKQGI